MPAFSLPPMIPFPSQSVQVAAGGIGAAAIAADAITAAKIANDAIDATAIAAGAFTAAKFAAAAFAGQIIKSVQAFTLTISAATTANQAITAVDLAKSIIVMAGWDTDTNSLLSAPRLVFITNIQVRGSKGASAGVTNVSFFVVEFQ